MAAANQQAHLFLSSTYAGTHRFRKSSSGKISNVFDPRKSFPGHQLNAASRKSLEIQASSIAKQRTLWYRNLCNKGFQVL